MAEETLLATWVIIDKVRFMTDTALKTSHENPKAIGLWLFLSSAMVLAMMIIGAITRLTESGLSMTEWRPLIGWIPPIGDVEWQRVFSLYQQTSQYKLANVGMSVEEFKNIFFWEYIHRVWGRLIGLVFALPLFFFFIKGMIPVGYKKHLIILLLLGGLQGFIGWWMVKSGFVDRTEVSQYRLAVHLGMAFIILGYLVWLAIGLVFPIEAGRPDVPRGFRRLGSLTHEVIFFTILSGALVAGLGAGLAYNDWPFMDDQIFPEYYWELDPWWLNFFENIAAVQFDHRLFAYITILFVGALFIWSKRLNLAPRLRLSINCLTAILTIQVMLGISTLMLVVPIDLAVMHQGGAALTFCTALWVMKELRGKAQK